MGEVIVVGAGAGGLSSAVALAARGVAVRVVEAGDRPGGKLGIATIDGVEVDTGPSVLTLPDTLDRTFRLAGSSLADELELIDPAPAFRYLYPDGVALDVFTAPEATLASVRQTLGATAEAELAAFLCYAGRIWDAAAPQFVYGPAPSVRTMASGGWASLALLPRIDPLHTMWSAIRHRMKSLHLRWLLARYATYNGSDPRRAPATLNCIAHVELSLGGFGVRGGMYEIVRALVRTAERLGVRFEYGARVERIGVRGGRAAEVEAADGRKWMADAVVANADAALVHQHLLPPEARPRSREAPPSTSGWVGVMRARRRSGADARVAHTVLFPPEYLREFEDLFDHEVPPREPTVYLCAQEACHARAGWREEEPVFVMANAPAEPWEKSRSPEAWPELRETVLRRLNDAGLLDPGDALVWERTPAGLATQFPGSRGGIYGAASNSPLAAFRRPANRVTGVRGLYLASGSAHPGGGVPLCILSGHAAAAALLADLGRPVS